MNNKVMVLRGNEPEKILRTAINKQIVAIMSYLSKGKWHVAKVLLTELEGDRLSIESAAPKKKLHPLNIQPEQPVGISFKYEYGKFVFDTMVVSLEASSGPEADQGWGGKIVLSIPDRIEVVQRRSYFRVEVPQSLKVKVVLWHRNNRRQAEKEILVAPDEQAQNGQTHNYCQGRLIDISAGGAQVVVPYQTEHDSSTDPRRDSTSKVSKSFSAGDLDLRKGQFVGMRFTPMPYETPVMISAQIRTILPTSDGNGASLGLQIVGLEASPEGREVLARLIDIVEKYYQINQSGARQHDIQPAQNTV
ncbi:MAG: PilZ domain-containing protein [Sedimentisphaerales bacterium]|nr:PilZ domain-containing protein [Sedimentisphaerales bacterium]